MRRFIAGTLVGATLAGSATAFASASWQHYGNGVLCKSYKSHGALCVSGKLGVGIGVYSGYQFVLVTDGNNHVYYKKVVYGG